LSTLPVQQYSTSEQEAAVQREFGMPERFKARPAVDVSSRDLTERDSKTIQKSSERSDSHFNPQVCICHEMWLYAACWVTCSIGLLIAKHVFQVRTSTVTPKFALSASHAPPRVPRLLSGGPLNVPSTFFYP
jgi:hypothetical protein